MAPEIHAIMTYSTVLSRGICLPVVEDTVAVTVEDNDVVDVGGESVGCVVEVEWVE